MSDQVVFEDESANQVSQISIVRGAPSGMLAWLIKSKLAKNGKQAEMVLLVAAIVIIVLAAGIYYFYGTNHSLISARPTTIPGPNGILIPVTQ